MSFVPFNDQQSQQQQQQQQHHLLQQPQQPQQPQSANGYGPNSYFMNNPYPPSLYQQQQQMAFQQNFQAPQPTYQQRQQVYNNDATNGLVHQFSHQNLGGVTRGGFGARQPSPSQRPRTAGAPSGSPSSNFLNAPMPALSFQQPAAEYEIAPERNPDKYTSKELAAARACSESAANFFKESVKRARERNERQAKLEDLLKTDTAMSQTRKEQKWSNAGKAEARFLRFLRTKESPNNFKTLKIIGKGAFGEVKLVQKASDGKVYALKSLVKAEMFRKDQLAHVRAERDILAESDSPWVVKLYTTFQDTDFLYMLMEFLPGGDLMTMLIKYEIFSEDITRFYIAEIVLAIEAVHKLGFIHRDIKPDNILLDRNGHIKLTDFGLSTGFHKLHDNNYYQQLMSGRSNKPKDRNSVSLDQINLTVSNRSVINDWRKSRRIMAYSTVGTPDYIAPEIFSGSGYSFDCDWWSLGTIMFECQVGWPPFCAEDPHDTYRKIVNWRQSLYFPDDVQLGPEAENLIRSLICNTENRLGRGGAAEIKAHPFFRGVIFDQLRKIRAPFEPKLTSNVDTTYFPIDEIDQTDNATHLKAMNAVQPREANPELALPFLGYTYKRFESNMR